MAGEIVITTFGWKHRQRPADQDFCIDAWLLPNPYTEHQNQTGLDPAVKAWLHARKGVDTTITKWTAEAVRSNAKTIAVGCHGGRHRSVFTAEEMAKALRALGKEVIVKHLDLLREKN
jgi:UPF0042 nucleotide-binding protein